MMIITHRVSVKWLSNQINPLIQIYNFTWAQRGEVGGILEQDQTKRGRQVREVTSHSVFPFWATSVMCFFWVRRSVIGVGQDNVLRASETKSFQEEGG